MMAEWKSWRLQIYARGLGQNQHKLRSRFINRCWNLGPRYLQVRTAAKKMAQRRGHTFRARRKKVGRNSTRRVVLEKISLDSIAGRLLSIVCDASAQRALVARGVFTWRGEDTSSKRIFSFSKISSSPRCGEIYFCYIHAHFSEFRKMWPFHLCSLKMTYIFYNFFLIVVILVFLFDNFQI